METRRTNVIKIAAIVIVIVLLGWWLGSYVSATPSYALYRFEQAVVAKNGVKAAQYVDFESVTNSLIDEEEKARATMQGPNAPPTDPRAQLFGQMLTREFLRMMAAPIAQALRSNFIGWVESPDTKLAGANFTLLRAVLALRRSDDSATTSLTDEKGQTINVGMRREGGQWKITSLSGPAVREFFERQLSQLQRRMP